MKTALLLLSLFSMNAMAKDCMSEALSSFKASNPKFSVIGINAEGKLNPGEEKPYLQGEIWNSGKTTLDVFEIDSAFMAKFVHVALVNPATCKTEQLIEVFFE